METLPGEMLALLKRTNSLEVRGHGRHDGKSSASSHNSLEYVAVGARQDNMNPSSPPGAPSHKDEGRVAKTQGNQSKLSLSPIVLCYRATKADI